MKTHQSVKLALFLFLAVFPFWLTAQKKPLNPFNLPLIDNLKMYDSLVKTDSNQRLVDLEKFIPELQLDIRYATTENFTGRKVYTIPKAWARLPLAEALRKVVHHLEKQGLGLKVFDAYRPYAATLLFWEIVKDTLFVADPAKGSRHNRGCSVDVSLIDLKTGKEVEMPTGYDDFTIYASVADKPDSKRAADNRETLIRAMEQYGFRVMPSEWWHYDYENWQRYPLMDISLETLETRR